MLQVSNSEMNPKIMERNIALNEMYYMEAIKTEINETMAKSKEGKLSDSNVSKNLDYIKIIG